MSRVLSGKIRPCVTYDRLENSRPNVSWGYRYALCEAARPGHAGAGEVVTVEPLDGFAIATRMVKLSA